MAEIPDSVVEAAARAIASHKVLMHKSEDPSINVDWWIEHTWKASVHEARAALTAARAEWERQESVEIDRLRAQLARAVEGLEMIAGVRPWDDSEQGFNDKARALLKELS
jgi:hypothetical protein